MTREEIIKVFDTRDYEPQDSNSTFTGLAIIAKYSNYVVQGADHDIIYSEDIDNLIDADITDEDIFLLADLGFFIMDGSYLARYV